MRLRELALAFVPEHRVVALVFLGLFAVYALLAAHAYPADEAWFFDFIETGKIFYIDDAYRYYAGRGAWTNPDLWSWVYVLPAELVFKGVTALISGGDIVLMRWAHLAVNLVGLYLLYLSLLRLQVRSWLAFLSSLVVALMPLYVTVAMSFFGESLLTAMVSVVIYLHVSGRHTRAAGAAGWMPLVQPEGFFLLLPLVLSYALHKDIRRTALALAPGTVYFVYLMLVYQGRLDEYLTLHFTITTLYEALPTSIFDKSGWAIPITLNPVLVVLSLSGFLHQRKRLWPLAAGPMLWVAFYVVVVLPLQGYEPRFLLPCVPALALGFGCALERFARLLSKQTAVSVAVLGLLPLLVLVENLAQLDPLRTRYFAGQRWPIGAQEKAVTAFYRVLSQNTRHGEDMARRVEAFLAGHPEYSWLVVQDHDFFYYLDPTAVPADVRVCFAPFKTLSVYYAFENRFFCMSSDAPRTGFFQLLEEPERQGEKALLVGDLSLYGMREAYANHRFKVYETTYREVPPPPRLNVLPREREDIEALGRDLERIEPRQIYPEW